jgi:hypothetical protein
MEAARRSAERLALVQRSLRGAARGARAALLAVPGPDGAGDPGSQRLAKYLWLDASGEELLEATLGGDGAALLEDCVLLVRAEGGASVYCPAAAHGRLAPLLRHWPAVRLFRGLAGGDAEAAERAKVQSLCDMLAGVDTVALPTAGGAEHERWPLVQAFALDEMAQGGFLSSVKRILHVGPELEQLFRHCDRAAERGGAAAERLAHHWGSALRLASGQLLRCGALSRAEAEDGDSAAAPSTSLSAFDSLATLVEFGQLRELPLGAKDAARSGGAGASLDDATGLLLVRAEEPASTLRCSRSYFAPPGMRRTDDAAGAVERDARTREALLQAYGRLGAALSTALALCERTLDPAAAREMGATTCPLRDASRQRASRRLLRAALESLRREGEPAPDGSLELRFESFDLAGRRASEPQASLGGGEGDDVAPCESLHFVELRLTVQAGLELWLGETVAVGADSRTLVNLTHAVPRFWAWPARAADPAALAERRQGQLARLGPPLAGASRRPGALVLGGAAQGALQRVEGTVQVFERGLAFRADACAQALLVDLAVLAEDSAGLALRVAKWSSAPGAAVFCTALGLPAGAASSPAPAALSGDLGDDDHDARAPSARVALPSELLLQAGGGSAGSSVALVVRGGGELSDATRWFESRGWLELEDGERLRATSALFARSPLAEDVELALACAERRPEAFAAEPDGPELWVVAGLGGASGKGAVARTLAALLGSGTAVLENELMHAASFDAARFCRRAAAALAGGAAAVVAVTPGDTPPEALAAALLSAVPSTAQRNAARVRALTVINVRSARARRRGSRCDDPASGLLLQQCSPGLVRAVALAGAVGVRDSSDAEGLIDALRAWNPEAELFRLPPCLPDTAVLDPSALDDLCRHVRSHSPPASRLGPLLQLGAPASSRSALEARVVYSSEAVLCRERVVAALARLTLGGARPAPASDAALAALATSVAALERDLSDLDAELGLARGHHGAEEGDSAEAADERDHLPAGKTPALRRAQRRALAKVLRAKRAELDSEDARSLRLPPGDLITVSGTVALAAAPAEAEGGAPPPHPQQQEKQQEQQEQQLLRYTVAAENGVVHLRALARDEGPSGSRSARTVGLLFEGLALGDHDGYVSLVRELQPRLWRTPLPVKAEDVPARRRAALERELAARPLPQGTCFDGRGYVGADGARRAEHPALGALLCDWARRENERAEASSRAAASELRARDAVKISGF